MSRCLRCKLEILDETERCPLCGSVLEQTDRAENMYPDVKMKNRRFALVGRIYLFCALALEAVFAGVNLHGGYQTMWSVITGLVLFYVYLLFRFAIIGQSGYKFKVIVLALIAVSMAVIIDFVAGYRGWSVSYAYPAGVLTVDAVILILMWVNRRNWQSYILWQIFMILASLPPVILACFGIVKDPKPTMVAAGVSVFIFLGTMIIGDRRARVELKRRFHIR